ncbi:MAG TPA: tetratricopeptide repeat protein [Bacteroidales bacterium]|jgi:serine phosphatase RsbU (regulator of sigma subunit)|nr:tetratricopeptide repeat protein [Bacteroidales bacterium]
MDAQKRIRTAVDKVNEAVWAQRYSDPGSLQGTISSNLAKAEKAGYERGIAYANLNTASVLFHSSQNDQALIHLNKALQWFSRHENENGYVRAILLQGNVHESYGDYEQTLTLWLLALKKSKQINYREAESEACNQLGIVYFRLADYEKSLDYLTTALKIREKENDENGMASSLNRIGMVLRQTKKYSESLQYYFKSLEIREKNRQFSAILWTMLGIASTCEESGNLDEALEYYTKGMESKDLPCFVQCLMGAGRIHSRRGENVLAEGMLEEASKKAEQSGTLYLLADAYYSLAAHYERTGKFSGALDHYKLYQKTKESQLSEESQRKLRNIEISHAIEKSEQEKEIFRLRNVELKQAYDIIEEKNKDITSSINYASRIQGAILPRLSDIKGLSGHVFVLYLPKDIISGDFYWFSRMKDQIVLVAGDCTGHGVPGALMSMLGISFLEEIVNRQGINEPNVILDELGKEIRRALRQKSGETKDGMDMSLCRIDTKSGRLLFSGANNNLYLVRDNQLIEIKSDRMAVGFNEDVNRKFSLQEVNLAGGDMLYMFSDGFADQFGGEHNKKYKYSAFKEFLLGIHNQPLSEQKLCLRKEFFSWKAEYEQVDDVLVMGYRFK